METSYREASRPRNAFRFDYGVIPTHVLRDLSQVICPVAACRSCAKSLQALPLNFNFWKINYIFRHKYYCNQPTNRSRAQSGEDDRFNLSYGGIMDDEIQEMAPLPVKLSQVKVCQFPYLCKYY